MTIWKYMKKNMLCSNKKRGFTLIELLIVVAIMAVLSIVTLVALKPAQRMMDSRDARRAQDVNQILTGIQECIVDKNDSSSMDTCLGSHVVGDTYEIVTGAVTTGCNTVCTGATSASSCLPLDTTLADYFVELPKDPNVKTSGHTGYSITTYVNGMVVLEACGAENGVIKVSR